MLFFFMLAAPAVAAFNCVGRQAFILQTFYILPFDQLAIFHRIVSVCWDSRKNSQILTDSAFVFFNQEKLNYL
jgi:hypothetical protein